MLKEIGAIRFMMNRRIALKVTQRQIYALTSFKDEEVEKFVNYSLKNRFQFVGEKAMNSVYLFCRCLFWYN